MHVFLLASGDKNRHKPYSLAVCLRLLFRYLAGDDPLTPRRCEPVPAVTWSLDREQPRRRSLSGMAGDDPPTPSWREPVPAVAWSLDREQPRRRSSSGMAGDDPLTPSRCEPVPAVTWSLDPKRPCTTTKKGNPAGFPQRQRRGRPTAQMPFLRPWRFGRVSSVRRFASSICSNVPISSARRSSQCPCSATGLPTCAVPCGT